MHARGARPRGTPQDCDRPRCDRPTLRPAALLAAALFAQALGLDAPRRAQADDGVRRPRATAPFWARVTEPGAARAATLLASARGWLDLATGVPGGWATLCPALDAASARLTRERLVKQSVAADNAIARLTLARADAPRDPAIVYALALATSLWERPDRGCAVRRRDADARALWQALRDLDPGFESETVGAELALAHTRLGDVDAAIAAYAQLVQQTEHAPRKALLAHGNLAELLMLRGDLRAAVAHYERAAALAREADDPDALALAELGLACALDRLGEHAQALTVARAAVDRSGDSLRVLRSGGVFFVPAWEVHVYEALGHEARADGTRAPLPAARARSTRAEGLARALDALLARPLSREALDTVARGTAAWLAASGAGVSEPFAREESAAARSLGETLARVGAAHEAQRRREREVARSASLRTLADDAAPSAVATAETRDRLTLGGLAAAARSWRRYLDEGGADGPSAAHAGAHLTRLAARIATLAARPAAQGARRDRLHIP